MLALREKLEDYRRRYELVEGFLNDIEETLWTRFQNYICRPQNKAGYWKLNKEAREIYQRLKSREVEHSISKLHEIINKSAPDLTKLKNEVKTIQD